MPGHLGVPPTTAKPELPGKRLDSWKEIAGYLNRHVTTVRRWERQEALPVHRHLHAKLGSIYAYTHELDTWFESRRRDESRFFDATASDTPATPERLPAPPSLAALPSEAVPLSGRDGEMKLLERAWDLACREQQQIVLISGEPGVGKTRLALEFARSMAKRSTVLVGRCDREALVPFAPWVTILQWLVRATPAQTLRRRLSEIEGSIELAQIAPEITRRTHLAEEPVSATPEGHRYRMFEACSELLVATSRGGPVLLVVEDVHWADRGSLLLLRYVVRSTRGAAICIIVTYRDEEPEFATESQEALDDLRREHSTTRIALASLSEDDVRRVVQSWIGREPPAWLTSFVVKHTEGNPLFVTEMLRHLEETGGLTRLDGSEAMASIADLGLPEGARQLIARRLGRLSPTTHRLLTLAAVIGREFRLSVLEALVDLSEDAVLDAMDEALTAKIITEEPETPGSFSFTHTLIRETLYRGIAAARRVRLHYRIADALERQSATNKPPLGELAYHFGQAAVYKGAEKAVDYAVRAGDHATVALALEDAARYYEMALRTMDLLPGGPESNEERFDLQVKRGRSCFRAGQWARAKSAFDAAVSLLDPLEATKRCELLVSLAETSFWLLDVPALRRYASEAQELADRVGRDDLWADALAWTASAKVADGDVLGGIQTDRQALARVGGIRSFGLARVPLTLYWAGRVREAADYALQAVECARASDDPAFLLYALQHLGLSLSGAGRYDEALRAFDEARTFGRRCGALPLLARATSMSVAPLLSLGDLDAAMARAFEARELANRVAFEPPLVSSGIDLLLIFARLEDPGRAESLLDATVRAVQKASGWHAWKWNMRLWQARAELASARGDWTEAIRAATNVIDQARARHRLKYEALGLATRARARKRRGARQAVDDARAAAHVARRLADPAVLLHCLTVLLEVDGSDALRDEARQTAHSILGRLSQESLRSAFLNSLSGKERALLDR
jgi:tetratricopeptide (TPR) repeat protein